MAKKTKVPSKSRLSTRKVEAPMIIAREEPAAAPTIERDDIARLAFAKFVARGYVHGHAVADWLSAEAELRATMA